MNREIKFRLIKDGKIVGYENHILRPQCGDSRPNVICVCYLTPEEILDPKAYWKCSWFNNNDFIDHDAKEQFTGLLDKDGKEGYKSDKALISTMMYVIDWNACNACYYLKNIDEQQPNLAINNLLVGEIIGNIHDNEASNQVPEQAQPQEDGGPADSDK